MSGVCVSGPNVDLECAISARIPKILNQHCRERSRHCATQATDVVHKCLGVFMYRIHTLYQC
jgi:hypothetical protein